jgi:hypothetical protein
MEIDNVEELLDYVFTEKDFSLTPSEAEYRKLGRIMVIMIRFYEKGSATKKAEYDRLMGDMARLDVDEKMITEQIEVLQNFPPIHPKRGEYEANLEEELEALRAARERVAPQITHWKELYDWSLKIVETVNWLGKQLEEYSNHAFQTKLEVNPEASKLSVELFRIYKRGLDEITYNLQESQDFFDASLDGRLGRFHEIEKTMVEALLAVVRKYPEDSARRLVAEPELEKDLEYVIGNMTLNPKVVTRRTNMRAMHQDFFSLLKWQREKMLRVPFDEPHKLTGDVASLKAELEARTGETVEQAVEGKLVPSDAPHAGVAQAATAVAEMTIQERAAAGGCPVAHKIPAGATIDDCPVAHKYAAPTTASDASPAPGATTDAPAANGQFTIHRLYD